MLIDAFKVRYPQQWERIKSEWVPGFAEKLLYLHDWTVPEEAEVRFRTRAFAWYWQMIEVHHSQEDYYPDDEYFPSNEYPPESDDEVQESISVYLMYRVLLKYFNDSSAEYLPAVFKEAADEAYKIAKEVGVKS